MSTIFPLSSRLYIPGAALAAAAATDEAGRRILTFLSLGDSIFPSSSSSLLDYQGGLSSIAFCFVLLFLRFY